MVFRGFKTIHQDENKDYNGRDDQYVKDVLEIFVVIALSNVAIRIC